MTIHHLKTLKRFFASVVAGRKPYELRRDDRGFEVGDELVLQEWDEESYTGFQIRASVSHILRPEDHEGLRPGYVVLGLVDVVGEVDSPSGRRDA